MSKEKEKLQTYTEDKVIDGIRIVVNKKAELEAKLNFCLEHKFTLEAEALRSQIVMLGSLRSRMQDHFDILGLYIKPNN